MKTSNTILCSLLGVVLVVASLLMARFWPHTLRDDQCSPLYQRYCHTPGIEASYVKGFRINDTLFVDATLLHATDSASWATLKTDFEIPELPPDFMERINDGQDLVFTKKIPKQQGISAQDTCGIIYYVAAFSHLMHTVSIFHTKDINERYAVMYHNYDHNVRQCTKDTPQ